MSGSWSTSLELPDGYQNFSWYKPGINPNGIWLDDTQSLLQALGSANKARTYVYTHHQVFHEDNTIKHTRSSPNWEGGLVTYSTCKHLMRSYAVGSWVNTWLVGLGPKECADNCVMFIGRVSQQFESNHELYRHLQTKAKSVLVAKRADTNPRGDLYTPVRRLVEDEVYNHANYLEPPNHTRSLEMYKKSPGSVSDREDGKIPKWWRDLEYLQRGRRPVLFTLSPCWLYSKPVLWTSYSPKRAVLKVDTELVLKSLIKR